MSDKITDPILKLPLEQVPDYMNRSARAGSDANSQMVQALCVRIAIESMEAMAKSASTISRSTDQLSAMIADNSKASDASNRQLLQLNRHLAVATWVMALLTLVLAGVGVIQVF